MKKAFKILAIGLISLVIILGLSSFLLTQIFENGSSKVYAVDVSPVEIPTDSASLERGMVLAVSCRHCHGTDLSGKYFFDDPNIGKLAAPNLTRAKGSPLEHYSDTDYVRALRHGLNPRGNPLMIMPSESYTNLSDKDLGSLIAFLKQLQPKENALDPPSFTYLSKTMAGAGLFGEMYPYHLIDHQKAKNIPHPDEPPSLAYGAYFLKIGGCANCHNADLGGGQAPDPVSPPVPNISKSGNPGKWTKDQFLQVIRTGKTPEGKMLNDEFMPFTSYAAFSDEELTSLYDYIMSLPAASPKE